MLPSALVGPGAPPFFIVKVSGGLGAPMVDTLSLPASGPKPGACAANDHCPDFRPMIEKRPLSSVVAVKLLGEAAGFSAVTVAPLIGLPASSFTVPPTRPVWAHRRARERQQTQRDQHTCGQMKTLTHARNPL